MVFNLNLSFLVYIIFIVYQSIVHVFEQQFVYRCFFSLQRICMQYTHSQLALICSHGYEVLVTSFLQSQHIWVVGLVASPLPRLPTDSVRLVYKVKTALARGESRMEIMLQVCICMQPFSYRPTMTFYLLPICRIVVALSAEERGMFRERIRYLEKKIKPGLTKITWASRGMSDVFIQDCRLHAGKVSLD